MNNKIVDIKISVHDVFLDLKIWRLDNETILKCLGAKGVNRTKPAMMPEGEETQFRY
jgi:hypothetical protein